MSDRVSMVGRLLLVLCALVFLGVLGRVAQLQLEPDERLSGNVKPACKKIPRSIIWVRSTACFQGLWN